MFSSFARVMLSLSVSAFPVAEAQELGTAIDTQRSTITIRVGKSGILAAAAHEHWVDAPVAKGTVDANAAAPSVRFTVNARALSVRPEKGVSDKDQAEIQSNMQTKVLESSSFPEMTFRSTRVQPTGTSAWRVSGELTLHGKTKPVAMDVVWNHDAYSGATRIKQSDFGIQPISIGGGVVKVKDELAISFEIHIVTR